MGPRTERELLPPESARAIYLTIETQGEALRHEIAHGTKSANERLDRIVQALDEMKDQMADGRVKFEHHEGKISILGTKIEHVNERVTDVKKQVDDVESDFGKIYPAALVKRGSPTGLHPTVTTVPHNSRPAPESSSALEKKPPRLLFFISPKLVNTFLLAAVAVIGTAVGGWIVSYLTAAKMAQMIQANTPPQPSPTTTP